MVDRTKERVFRFFFSLSSPVLRCLRERGERRESGGGSTYLVGTRERLERERRRSTEQGVALLTFLLSSFFFSLRNQKKLVPPGEPERGREKREKEGKIKKKKARQRRGKKISWRARFCLGSITTQLQLFLLPFAPRSPPLQPCSLLSPPRSPRGKQHAVPKLSRAARAGAPHLRAPEKRGRATSLSRSLKSN